MAGAESAATTVLTGEPNGGAFEQKRTKRERFRVMPFVRSAGFENFAAPIEHVLFDLRNDFEVFRHARERIDDLFQHVGADRSRPAFRRVLRLKDRRRSLEPRL